VTGVAAGRPEAQPVTRPSAAPIEALPAAISGKRLAIGALAASVAAMPLLRPAGPGNSGPADVAIAVAILATLYWAGSAKVRLRVPYAAPVGMLVVAGGLAALVNGQSGSGAIALTQDLLLLAWAAAIANIGREPSAVRTLLRAWALSSIVWAGVLVSAVVVGNTSVSGIVARNGGRAALTFGDANLAASYFVVSIMIVVAARYPRHGLLRYGGMLLLLGALATTGSNGGFIALAAASAIVVLAALVRRVGLVPATAVVAAAVPFAVATALHFPFSDLQRQAADPRSALHQSIGRSNESTQSRSLVLRDDLRLYFRGTPLGIGPGATKPTLTAEQSLYAKEAHNDYIGTLAERGVLGAVGLLLLVGTIATRSRAIVREPRSPELAAVLPRPSALVAALVALSVSALFYEVLHFRQLWALLGIVAALQLAGRRE
jgi:O-antigen ligase